MKKIMFSFGCLILALMLVTPDALARGRGLGNSNTPTKLYGKKKSGPYVVPLQRTAPDKSKSNNLSPKGNTNPYTGKKGTTNLH